MYFFGLKLLIETLLVHNIFFFAGFDGLKIIKPHDLVQRQSITHRIPISKYGEAAAPVDYLSAGAAAPFIIRILPQQLPILPTFP